MAKAEDWVARAIEAASIGTWCWEIGSGELRWSATTCALFGVDPATFSPTFERYLACVAEPDRARIVAAVTAIVSDGQPYALEHRVDWPTGERRWLACRSHCDRDATGAIWRVIGSVIDVTDRRRAEELAFTSQSRLAAVLNNTPEIALQGFDADGRVVFWNTASEQMFGWRAAEAVGQTLDGLIFNADEWAAFLDTLRRVHETGQPTPPTEGQFRRRDGEIGWCLSTLFRLSGPDEPPLMVCMDVDRTRDRRMRDQMIRSERLESLGRLAGGIAHDFNNLLTTMLGFTDLALERADDVATRDSLLRVREAGQRGASLTQQLLAYARQQVVKPKRVDLDVLLGRITGLLPRLLAPHVHLVVEASGGLPPVLIDPVQFDQIVMNLAINASDAMPDGGRVVLSTSRRVVPAGASVVDVPPGDWVVFTVRDSGTGIAPEHLSSLFEPFFTTKPLGKGTGLGLPTCYGIARQNGGCITVFSEPGRGARFDVYLPAAAGVLDALDDHTAPSPPPRRETVLVVEDDPAILHLAVLVLGKQGYRVLQASDGDTALALAAQHADAIDVLVSDVVMPGLGGHALADALVRARPDLRVLLTSGYDHELAGGVTRLPDAFRFLQKPYTPRDLIRAVHELLV